MNKKEIQVRVLRHGKPIPLDKFTWDSKKNIFTSSENSCVFEFSLIEGITFNTGSSCTFKTGAGCTFNTGSYCAFNTGDDCNFDTGFDCSFMTGDSCKFKTGADCAFKTGADCIFNTKYSCNFFAKDNCTFSTGPYCVFNTRYCCTFNTDKDCTFEVSSGCEINTCSGGVIIRRDAFEVIACEKNSKIIIPDVGIPGYVSEGIYSVTGKPAIIADGILSEIISKKRNIYKVKNYGEKVESFLIEKDGLFSHGKTIEEAKESLIYKIGDRDTSEYNSYTLKTIVTIEEAIKMYRVITGACESGTRAFVEKLDRVPKKLTVAEMIYLTRGQYNNQVLADFINKKKYKNV